MEKAKLCSLTFSQRVRELALGRGDRAEGVYVSWVPRSRIRVSPCPPQGCILGAVSQSLFTLWKALWNKIRANQLQGGDRRLPLSVPLV